MFENIDYWRDAPVWTVSSIAEATADWFKYLGSASSEKQATITKPMSLTMDGTEHVRMDLIKTASKILTVGEIAAQAQKFRADGFVVVQAHGTFDLLHLGHVRHLEAARALGDVLVVTITADRFVNKGPGRPVFTGSLLRAEMLAALHFVTYVAIAEAPDAISAIEAIKPEIYAKGNDYQNPDGDVTGKITLERNTVEAHGGSIRFTDEITFSLHRVDQSALQPF